MIQIGYQNEDQDDLKWTKINKSILKIKIYLQRGAEKFKTKFCNNKYYPGSEIKYQEVKN